VIAGGTRSAAPTAASRGERRRRLADPGGATDYACAIRTIAPDPLLPSCPHSQGVVAGLCPSAGGYEHDYRALFDRVRLDIGRRRGGTDRRAAETLRGGPRIGSRLEALYFQYGRYLLIASSRAGFIPANLQACGTIRTRPPWNADFTQHQPADELLAAERPISRRRHSALRFRRQPGRTRPARGEAHRRARADAVPQHGRLGLRRPHRLANRVLQPEAALARAALLRTNRFTGDEAFLRKPPTRS